MGGEFGKTNSFGLGNVGTGSGEVGGKKKTYEPQFPKYKPKRNREDEDIPEIEEIGEDIDEILDKKENEINSEYFEDPEEISEDDDTSYETEDTDGGASNSSSNGYDDDYESLDEGENTVPDKDEDYERKPFNPSTKIPGSSKRGPTFSPKGAESAVGKDFNNYKPKKGESSKELLDRINKEEQEKQEKERKKKEEKERKEREAEQKREEKKLRDRKRILDNKKDLTNSEENELDRINKKLKKIDEEKFIETEKKNKEKRLEEKKKAQSDVEALEKALNEMKDKPNPNESAIKSLEKQLENKKKLANALANVDPSVKKDNDPTRGELYTIAVKIIGLDLREQMSAAGGEVLNPPGYRQRPIFHSPNPNGYNENVATVTMLVNGFAEEATKILGKSNNAAHGYMDYGIDWKTGYIYFHNREMNTAFRLIGDPPKGYYGDQTNDVLTRKPKRTKKYIYQYKSIRDKVRTYQANLPYGFDEVNKIYYAIPLFFERKMNN